jgi:hypothetical protein
VGEVALQELAVEDLADDDREDLGVGAHGCGEQEDAAGG